MGTQTLQRVTEAGIWRRTGMAAYLGAAAFIVATVWYALAVEHVLAPAPPQPAFAGGLIVLPGWLIWTARMAAVSAT